LLSAWLPRALVLPRQLLGVLLLSVWLPLWLMLLFRFGLFMPAL